MEPTPRATHLTPLLEERECLVGKYMIFIIWSEMILEYGPNSTGGPPLPSKRGRSSLSVEEICSVTAVRGEFQTKLNRVDLPLAAANHAVIRNTNSSEEKV